MKGIDTQRVPPIQQVFTHCRNDDQKYQLDLVEDLWYTNEKYQKNQKFGKNQQNFPFWKNLGEITYRKPA